eukprot:maker-scaffold683_size112676-snap-gene-0.13 protein:Tk08733 transcript:maker-scaffold683_size112676-snap-gene-0.13-mRNA-1 annotation:"scavenger receptor class b member 1"
MVQAIVDRGGQWPGAVDSPQIPGRSRTMLRGSGYTPANQEEQAPVKCQINKKYAQIGCGIGFLLLLGALLSLIYMEPYIQGQILKNLPLSQGSEAFEGWRNPPVHPIMYLFIFNLTNQDDFLSGKSKPIVEEVGPYAYVQNMSMTDAEFPSFDIVRFNMQRNFTFDPEDSMGLDYEDTVIVPNIPLFGAMHKLAKDPAFAKGIFLEILESYDFAQDKAPFLSLTVKEFIWGYDSILLSLKRTEDPRCVANKDGWSDFDDFGDIDSTLESDAEPKETKVSNVEDNTIDCDIRASNQDSFGLMSIRNVTKQDLREINTGGTKIELKGRMVSYEGNTNLDFWASSECNSIKSSSDPAALPMNLQKSSALDVYVAELCRKLDFKYDQEIFYDGVKTLRFLPLNNSFDNPQDNPENECYCLSQPCTRKSGLFDIESCKPGSPILMSWPHFLFGDPELKNGVIGINPDPSRHQFFMDVEPTYGFTLSAMAQFQMNVKIEKNNGFGFFDNINSQEVVLPFCYLKEGVVSPSKYMMEQIVFILHLPPHVASGLSWGLVALGLLLMIPLLIVWIRETKR